MKLAEFHWLPCFAILSVELFIWSGSLLESLEIICQRGLLNALHILETLNSIYLNRNPVVILPLLGKLVVLAQKAFAWSRGAMTCQNKPLRLSVCVKMCMLLADHSVPIIYVASRIGTIRLLISYATWKGMTPEVTVLLDLDCHAFKVRFFQQICPTRVYAWNILPRIASIVRIKSLLYLGSVPSLGMWTAFE